MMRVASAAFLAVSIFPLFSSPLAACYGCQSGYYPVGGPVVQAAPPAVVAPPVYQNPHVYQAPVYQGYQAPAVVQAPPVVVQQAPTIVQTAPVVVDATPRYYNGNYGYNGGYNSGYGYNGGQSYYDSGANTYNGGGYGRTVYYERGPEIPVSYREYSPYGGNGYGYGGNGYGYGSNGYGGGGYYGSNYAEPYYAPPAYPYYRPYYRRPVICTGGAYETGQAICGLRP